MLPLDKKYQTRLKSIQKAIQDSEILAQYLEEEDDEHYIQLKDEFEPQIEELHNEVVNADPLQILSLEEALFDPELEGLFLPRILGYAVLRGTLNESFKYVRPQEHFKNILMAIANSSNFDLISRRIGQTVEVGFALSSDIWITNLIAEVKNKTVVAFLEEHKLVKYRDIRSRHTAYLKYKNQFRKFNFLTANMPENAAELRIEYKSIVNFLLYRGSASDETSKSVYSYISKILEADNLGPSPEHLEVLMIIVLYFDLKAPEQKQLIEEINTYKKTSPDEIEFLRILRHLQSSGFSLSDKEYGRMNSVLDGSTLTTTKQLLKVIQKVNDTGYLNPDAIETVRKYYNQNKGLSLQNECLRNAIFEKFESFMTQLEVTDFADYFELNKTFVVYMNIFANEKFNQDVKAISMKYIKKLLKNFTVKRSKDYQDIKKFVSATFLDLGFLNEKQIKELFKTKRKKAKA